MTDIKDKPIVHYKGAVSIEDGRAFLDPTDHPNHLDGHNVSNAALVRTSSIISHDRATGRIETRNTIYMPEVL